MMSLLICSGLKHHIRSDWGPNQSTYRFPTIVKFLGSQVTSQPAHGKDNDEGEEDDEGDETNAMHNATDEVEVSGWFSRMSHCLL